MKANGKRVENMKKKTIGNALIEALRATSLPPPPNGAMSMAELCEEMNLGREVVSRMISKAGIKPIKCKASSGRTVNYYCLESGKC